MIHQMLAIWSLVPLPFLNPAWTSGSSRFMLKPGLENFEHYFASVWDKCNCAVVWAFFGTAFLWNWNENWPFPGLWPLPFSKFSGILSAALLQHHLSGFEITQLELSIFKKLRLFPLCPPPAKKVPSSCSFHLSVSKLSWFYVLPKPETWRSPGSLASSAQSVAGCGWDRSRLGLHKPGCLSQIPYAQVSCWQVFLLVFLRKAATTFSAWGKWWSSAQVKVRWEEGVPPSSCHACQAVRCCGPLKKKESYDWRYEQK